jgi:uncharacterized protein YbjT (DUF2867 family)
MILVIGASGTTGGAVLRELLDRGAPVRALTSSPAKVEALEALGAEVAVGNLDDPASLAGAMRDVERVYLVQPGGEQQLQRELNAIAVAEQAGAYHLVKLGVIGQNSESPLRFARAHADATEALQASSLRWTILEPNGFMQNYLASPPGVTARPDAAISHVDARDIGAVAARVLTEEGHEGCTYVLTGPEAITDREVAALLGAPVTEIDDEQLRRGLVAAGVPAWTADGLIELQDLYRSGGASGVAPDIEALLGRPAGSFARFVDDHRASFASAPER